MNHRLLLSFSCAFVLLLLLAMAPGNSAAAQTDYEAATEKFSQQDKFRQLEEILPTPNDARTASGAPAKNYWQQNVDYEIVVRLDDETQELFGSEIITYTNHSPDTLRYLWLQLDANIHQPDSDANLMRTTPDIETLEFKQLKSLLARETFDGSFKITKCLESKNNKPLKHTVVKTMLRIDLPQPLTTGSDFKFQIDWNYKINNSQEIKGRAGYERFESDGNYLYEMAQWFPRLCAYTDTTGWQHKQFLGRGEFTLELGDYVVQITVPEDHLVAATGTLLNPKQVLTDRQRRRLKKARRAKEPVFIVTPKEAKENESSQPDGTKTWIFKADQVRDFAFASSRKFIWDALQTKVGGAPVMAMSFYPNEAEPLWSQYSTHAIVHTLDVYSRYTFDYPYPVAISVNGPVYGMEYPMICFNGPRPDEDGTYTARLKYALLSVIFHEVGHNYFPMIVNSDERQWTWMDEGLNTFLQYLTEQEWEEGYPSVRGEPRDIVGYMRSINQVPIMTNSESLLQFGPNAYSKPCTALNILRETVLGRELFDFAFKEYARRWKFKRPMPADFFRTMEDASGIDLDWFWRGWFYSTDHVDIGIVKIRQLNVDTSNPETEKAIQRDEREESPKSNSNQRNQELPKRLDKFGSLKDFYNDFDELDVTRQEVAGYEDLLSQLSDEEKKLLEEKKNFYLIEFENVGGLVMPIIYDAEFEDGSILHVRLPAEIWRQNNETVSKLLVSEHPLKSLTLDPRLETADADLQNNYFPPRITKSRFQLFQQLQESNPMREAREADAEEEAKKKAIKEGRKKAIKEDKQKAIEKTIKAAMLKEVENE